MSRKGILGIGSGGGHLPIRKFHNDWNIWPPLASHNIADLVEFVSRVSFLNGFLETDYLGLIFSALNEPQVYFFEQYQAYVCTTFSVHALWIARFLILESTSTSLCGGRTML